MKSLSLLLYATLFALVPMLAQAKTIEYTLDIAREPVTITGAPVNKITVNGTIPGPILHFTEGDEAVITVTNHMDMDTSVHWHGMLVPGDMDGAPGFNGFDGIKPGAHFTYRFPIRQSGTYWYHSHSMGQEQEGLYGAIVIAPKGKAAVKANHDYVVLLSDFSGETPQAIMNNLKMNSAYYNHAQRTIGDFFGDVSKMGLKDAWNNATDWGQMRMSQTDIADVSGYTFLVNGQSPDQNWTGIFKRGDRVRLRFINASAMSFFDVRIPGLKMTVVAADGQNVEPLPVDEFRFGNAETYDVIVEPKEDKAYTIVAEPIDRSGFALATLAPHEGMKWEMPEHRPRALLSMFDMNMKNMMRDNPDMEMSGESAMTSGWAKVGTPAGQTALDYKNLRSLVAQKDTRPPSRTIEVHLGGNMERYIWTLNGKKFDEAEPLHLTYGERVRITFINDSMMAHPMHLHGMFVQLENGQTTAKMPSKHTVIVPPGQTTSVLLTVNEPGEWPFHCHLFYHMLSGMMTTVVVDKNDKEGGHHAQ